MVTPSTLWLYFSLFRNYVSIFAAVIQIWIESILLISKKIEMNKEQYIEKKKAESLSDNACQWITVKQLQDKLQVSSSTVYRWTRNNIIKAYRFRHSRNIYFLNSEIDEFLSHNPITPTGRLDKVGLTWK